MGWALVASAAASGSAVNFTGLGSYDEIMVLMRLVTTSGSVVRNLQVSSDNGSTYHTASGDYKTLADDGTETSLTEVPLHATASALARTGIVLLPNWKLTQPKPVLSFNRTAGWIVDLALALNALRVVPDSGTFSGGNVYVFGK